MIAIGTRVDEVDGGQLGGFYSWDSGSSSWSLVGLMVGAQHWVFCGVGGVMGACSGSLVGVVGASNRSLVGASSGFMVGMVGASSGSLVGLAGASFVFFVRVVGASSGF